MAILVGSWDHRTQFSKDYSTKIWLQLAQWFLRRRFLCEFPIGSYAKLSSAVRAILLSKWFQTRRFLWEFPIGFYVKLSSAVAAILVGGLKSRTQFWKGAIRGPFHQSLVAIGPVVSEKTFMRISHRYLC